ncbi:MULTISPECIES: hypothetical protein [unclassified Streptomyces]|uniref:hypothetical protein n=1 Tax=unclassified Streptomyces TaxID=2593676 RepID=UPI002DDA085B|nr:hypothetical protein [Streptomyces sp. NBC_01445]WSE10150.1 hypothetical protein OG574_46695 [Streptomyces sp. NBC_01445]
MNTRPHTRWSAFAPRSASPRWGARGLRPGWELDWTAAEAGPWGEPFTWTRVTDTELL